MSGKNKIKRKRKCDRCKEFRREGDKLTRITTRYHGNAITEYHKEVWVCNKCSHKHKEKKNG